MSKNILLPVPQYSSWLAELKLRIQAAQQRATLSVNRELILLYWQIGQDILQRQQTQGWGAKVIEQLAKDLTAAFPKMKGFSRRNLLYMRSFAEEWPDFEIVQQAVAHLPWGQNLLLLTKLKTAEERQWYAAKAIAHGWSRNVLWHHISTQLQQRSGKAVTNFEQRLPAADSELAQQTIKDPYLFDFLGVSNEAHEREIESAMTCHVSKMLMEMGEGFAFVGRQVPVEVDGQDFFIDLLFYNYRLHRFLVVELKAGDFKPEQVGQLNFYITLVDEKIKSEEDKPTLGLLLCQQQHRVVAQYALRGMTGPIGIAEYKLQLPDEVAKYLPSIAQIEAELLAQD
ncbi:Putative nuclease YhcG [Polaromonas vacuolata]|uniref:Nuclease YhcG n=1 Tax=Polaromonas vacuolata TaxID=37448 RepID=A0A6H2H647_9BURK|nr:PDDEXK nuclease domain-containing protein [Polaromonas vacuolata]QJC55328.1 Putative nuclease YhcG [Polaromonas vacuolata]